MLFYLSIYISYQLNTEAGFLIGRRAVCSLTSVGDGYYQGLIAVTTGINISVLYSTI